MFDSVRILSSWKHSSGRNFELTNLNAHPMYMRAHPQLTWFTPCWAVLACVKAAESQRPKGTPIQAETIYYLSAGNALRQRPARRRGVHDEAVVHGAAVQGRGGRDAAAAAAGGPPPPPPASPQPPSRGRESRWRRCRGRQISI
jgi:hypothetical protein